MLAPAVNVCAVGPRPPVSGAAGAGEPGGGEVGGAFERAAGKAGCAVGLAKAALEADPQQTLPDRAVEILLICQSGARSMQAMLALQARGYANVRSVAGGTTRWIKDGLPIVKPDGDSDFYERYSRHLKLSEVGEAGTRKLEAARAARIPRCPA